MKRLLSGILGAAILCLAAGQTQATLLSLELEEHPSPFGFLPLASLGVAAFACPADCDDGGVALNLPAFAFAGSSYSSVIWSVNGTIEVGAASGLAAGAVNQKLPDPTPPNNLLAPLWLDLDLSAGGNWYVAVLTAGIDQYTVFEWSDIPLFGEQNNRYSFQAWIQNGDSGNIWFTYDLLGDVSGATVGVENADGSVGSAYWFEGLGTAPRVGTDLKVVYEERAEVPAPPPVLLALLGLGAVGTRRRPAKGAASI